MPIAHAECWDVANSTPLEFIQWCSEASTWLAVLNENSGREWVKDLAINIWKKVIQFGALFAIWAIVFSGIRYTTSAWDDEKIKSAKNTAIYGIVWLLLLLMAFPLVDIIIGFIYSIWS